MQMGVAQMLVDFGVFKRRIAAAIDEKWLILLNEDGHGLACTIRKAQHDYKLESMGPYARGLFTMTIENVGLIHNNEALYHRCLGIDTLWNLYLLLCSEHKVKPEYRDQDRVFMHNAAAIRAAAFLVDFAI